MTRVNDFGQPVGAALDGWVAPIFPPGEVIAGRTVTLEPLTWPGHGEALFTELRDVPDSQWTYMSFGPFPDVSLLRSTLEAMIASPDWSPYAIVVDGDPMGFTSYLRMHPADGVIEVGSIVFSPLLQRTTAATEAMYIMIRRVFELGYRRCEWKCDDLNAASRSAALRLGFTYEGTFRQALHYKRRNRDTAWYAIIDREWPALDDAFQRWLAPENFTSDGEQRRSLKQMREQR